MLFASFLNINYDIILIGDKMINIKDIFPIGIGTFRINLENKEETLEGLLYSYELGQNYIDVSSLYENGKVMEFISTFLQKVDRNKIFVSCKISNDINEVDDISKYLNKYLEIMKIDYVDCLEFHEPFFSKIPLVDSYKEMQRLVDLGKARYLGISNCNLETLKELNEAVKIDVFDGLYNLECKVNEDIGILDYCKKNNIIFVCYQPLRRNRTANRNYEVLVDLSNKYNKTQNQIILNWIINEKGIVPVVKTTNESKIKENIDALNFKMDKEDYEKLNSFRSKEFDSLHVDWEDNGGITIDKYPNQFS
jgi:diketogulonate reductase-like aldo/keto reductase